MQSWNNVAEAKTYYGISEKFKQNNNLRNILQQTGTKTLVESSYDKIWGSGVGLNSPSALDKDSWNGNNLLDKILMAIRDDINNENDVDQMWNCITRDNK